MPSLTVGQLQMMLMRQKAGTDHTAVWTDNEMIIWGGENFSGYQDTGARYCRQLRTVGLPLALPTRQRHDQVIRPSGLAAK